MQNIKSRLLTICRLQIGRTSQETIFNVRSIYEDITLTIFNMSNSIFMSVDTSTIMREPIIKIAILNPHQTGMLASFQGILTK